jgi:rifampicin phosphotransferase
VEVAPETWVLSDPSALLARPAAAGGKAANLARLEALGLPVPPWYAIATDAFTRALGPDLGARIAGRLAAAGADDEALRRAAAEVREWVLGTELPAGLAAEIDRAHAARLPEGALVAVRSSAAGEDAAGESFAGLHDSFLFVRGRAGRLEAVRRVWASAFNERALAYRRAKGTALDGIAVGVVVQQMVAARVSGVLFTANPTTGSVHEVVVSALWGAGEGLVAAGFDADTFVVDKETLALERQVAEKSEQLVLDPAAGAGLARLPVPEELQRESSLTDEQARALARLGIAVERHFRRPQDVEFALDADGRVFLLQARPVTTVAEVGPAAGHRLLWDNSNIVESYAGVTSPMTFSFIRRAYSIVYHCFAEVMGIDPRVVRANREVFDNMLGLFRGRVYYNLLNWYRLVRLFPGFEYNRKFMESMMGVREPAALGDEAAAAAPVSALRRYGVELPALLRLLLRSARNFLAIRRIVGDFQDHFRRHYERWSAVDLNALAPHELLALYREMEEKLLWQWQAPIVNDFFVMVFYGTLKRLCTAWCGDAAGSLQNDLICGEGGIESTEPARRLLALAAAARRDPELAALLLEKTPEALAVEIPADPRWTAFAAEIARYLDLYGFRCADELKLEEPSLKERPAFLYQVLRNYLAQGESAALDPAAMEVREQGIRAAAEERAFAALRRHRGLLPRRAIFRWVLGNARLGVKNRENLRFARTRIYGLLRELLRAVGKQFAAEGLLDAADAVFYLTLDEVWDYVLGRAVTVDLRALAALRRAEFDAYRREEDRRPADRFETFGLPYHGNLFRGRPRPPAAATDGLLRGTGCCPGRVRGAVKVLRSPSEDARLDGEILVAERTDPGWVPLYPSISGLLVERGSILSHSAIVAREMGIPTIVGIPGLLAALATGQEVEMDGAAGTVRVVG